MPFGTVAHAPRQGQGTSLLDPVEPQRQAATTNDPALHAPHQRRARELRH